VLNFVADVVQQHDCFPWSFHAAHRGVSNRGVRALCRFVIQEIIKDMARNRSVEAKRKVKVLVLHEVDGLTKDAQHSLRRTMEKYSNCCRLVMLCNTVSKVCIHPLCCVITAACGTLLHVCNNGEM
jgi:DNA polymerase III delta prime subunit